MSVVEQKAQQDLSPNQERALTALLEYPTVSEAAAKCGLHERTVRRYLEDSQFRQEYMAARRECVSHASARLQAATSEAVEVLREVMNDELAPANAKVRAAEGALDRAARALELEDLDARLARLESMEEIEESRVA